jgi:hypothetical protein
MDTLEKGYGLAMCGLRRGRGWCLVDSVGCVSWPRSERLLLWPAFGWELKTGQAQRLSPPWAAYLRNMLT